MKGKREINPFGLRIPTELRSKLEDSAEINGRSLNAEILHRLEHSFDESETHKRLEILEKAMRKKGLLR